MKVTSKGQVTIPMEIRERAGIHPGDEVEITLDGEQVHVAKKHDGPTRGERLVAEFKARGRRARPLDPEMTTDELMALTRGE